MPRRPPGMRPCAARVLPPRPVLALTLLALALTLALLLRPGRRSTSARCVAGSAVARAAAAKAALSHPLSAAELTGALAAAAARKCFS
mmetsp:Transcript_90290/g.242125  ORF Transcript_90290/g.242125 Transcript_90290/m.242125 type:complete len:88 (-) Transcript_90290:61-324(-)